MISKPHVAAPHFKALNVGNLNKVKSTIAGIENKESFKVKGQKMNYSVISVIHKKYDISKIRHTANIDSIIF